MLCSVTFQTTRWSLILRARAGDAAGAEALDQLLAAYWQPVYVFYRRLGADRDAAADLTQGLFADLLSRGDLRTATPERGRFRSYLRSCARHFHARERERAAAHKRGGHLTHVPIDRDAAEAWLGAEPVDADDAEAVFERRWAQTVLDRALWRLEQEELAAGRSAQFALLRANLDGTPPQRPWAELAAGLDTSEGALKVAAHRLKAHFRACVTAEVRETLADAAVAGDELRELLVALQRPARAVSTDSP
jgi:RNA polymerase sigma-70 factor (ECF subfamily)